MKILMKEKMIHSTAVVSSHAKLGNNVKIGPFCFIGDDVKIGDEVEIKAYVHIEGQTEIGNKTKIFPFAVLGCIPQDLKYKGEESRVKIGQNCTIREHVTIHGGTKFGRMETTIGNNCLLMVASHVAHDCIVGNNVVMSNNATLGGHVIIEENVIIGGLAAVHQFVRIGKYSIIGGVSAVTEDVVPYASVAGDRAKILGVNTRGLRRNGIKNDDIVALQQAYKKIFRSSEGNLEARIKQVELEYSLNEKVLEVIKFLNENTIRPICTAVK